MKRFIAALLLLSVFGLAKAEGVVVPSDCMITWTANPPADQVINIYVEVGIVTWRQAWRFF